MPVHHFVELEGQEVTFCAGCNYVMLPTQLPIWTEGDMIEWIVRGNMKESDAKILVGTWLIGREFLSPSSQALSGRIADILSAAKVQGWRTPQQEKEIIVGVDKVAASSEQQATAYAKQYKVSMEQARHAIVNAYDLPPALVNPVSEWVVQRAKDYARSEQVSMAEAITRVLESDPAMAKAYLAVPVFPNVTAGTEETQEQLLASLTLLDLQELCVSRKLAVTDALMHMLTYEWFVSVGGKADGSASAASANDALWTIISRARFKREGFGGANVSAPGR